MAKRIKIFLSLLIILFSFGCSPKYEPTSQPTAYKPEQHNFQGLVKLFGCSGSIIILKGQPISNKALVLTNGHCLPETFKANQAIYKRQSNKIMEVSDSDLNFRSIEAKQLVYASLTNTDIAIFKLTESYQDLMDDGIYPLELSDKRPQLGTNIEILSGMWKLAYTCQIDAFIPMLIEDIKIIIQKEGKLIFTDSIRYSRGCKTIGGTSGSPIINSETREVIGVHNTTNRNGSPCEVYEVNNVNCRTNSSYGQQTYQIYSCLNEDFEFDLSLEGCLLPK